MTDNITTVSFHGSELITTKINDLIYVAMRPIVEAIGLSWAAQTVKLSSNSAKFNCFDIETVGADGKMRQMLCIPLKKLNGWLFSINPEKVKPEIKDKVIQYQEECFEVLHDYWTKGQSVNPRFRKEETRKTLPNGLTKEQQDTIKQFHKQIVESVPKEKQAKLAITLWSAVKSKYGVSYKEVPQDEFTGVISLMSRVAIENGFSNVERLNDGFQLPERVLVDVLQTLLFHQKMCLMYEHIYPVFKNMDSGYSSQIYDFVHETKWTFNECLRYFVPLINGVKEVSYKERALYLASRLM